METLIKSIDVIYQLVLKPVILLFFGFYYALKPRFRPEQTDNPILFISAKEISKKIREKKIKSEEVVRSYIDRIKQVQPLLNCVVDERFKEALEEARAIDRLIETNKLNETQRSSSILGVPFTCKELIGVKGLNFSTGLVARKGLKAQEDAQVIKLMSEAGAIIVCVTITSELGLWFESSNHIYGQSKNPFDSRRIVGGSSGGEGALISSMGSLIGIGSKKGSDIGGSIRMPAVFNGIYGHKPTNGLISNSGSYPPTVKNQDFMLTIGPLCRYSEDLSIVLNILLGKNKQKLEDFDNFQFKEAKFFYIEHLNIPFVSKMSEDVKRSNMKFVNFIENRFETKVTKLDGNDYLSEAFEMWFTMMTEGQSDQVCQLINVRDYDPEKKNASTFGKTPVKEALKALVRRTEHTLPTIGLALLEKLPISSSPNEIVKYLNLIEKTREKFDELLGKNGILIYPSFPSEAPFHNQALFTNPLDWIVYFGILNSIGLPSTQIPLGLTRKSQMPVGVQLVANRYCDMLTLRLAELLEREYAGWVQA